MNAIDLLLRETNGDLTANVYKTQSDLNFAFSGLYFNAYSHSNKDEPLKVHQYAATIGAKQLGLDVNIYLDLWDLAVETIDAFNELPDEFKDPRYIESNVL